MNTNLTLRTAIASVTGARHHRAGRNGQDAAAAWTQDGVAVVVVCDGCSSGASSEVGARLGARLFTQRLGARLAKGASVRERAVWEAVRGEVGEIRWQHGLQGRVPGDGHPRSLDPDAWKQRERDPSRVPGVLAIGGARIQGLPAARRVLQLTSGPVTPTVSA